MQLFSLFSARKLLLAAAAAGFLMLASTPLAAQDESFDQDDPPPQAGRLSYLSGSVSIQQVGSDDWGQASVNLPLGPGDRIYTDNDGRAEIQIGRTYFRIGPNSDVSFVSDEPNKISIGLAQGSVHLRTYGLWPGQRVYVDTPSGSGGVDSPGEELRVDVLDDEQAAIFTNFGAQAFASGPGYDATLHPGQCLELAGSNPVSPQWMQPADWDELDRWSNGRDQQIMRGAGSRYVSPEIPGAEELDANGSWIPESDYGPIWFPSNVSADWTPYHNGHWVNHDPWGWVWVEDEPWGYAPFHYGRWVSYEGRWGWVPGPREAHPVWSPALVVFAGGFHIGGAGISAWFPLGPGEAYRPWYHASPHYIDVINRSNIREAPRVHVERSYVNININIANIHYVNRRIAVTAVRHEDFAAGRSVRGAAVQVDRHQFDHTQIVDRPDVRPVPRPEFRRAPDRPVPVRSGRPLLINETGKQIVANKPNTAPVEPPVRPLPPMRPARGRVFVAPPPDQQNPHPMQPAQNQPVGRPAPPANNQQQPRPMPQPGDRPNWQQGERPNPQPGDHQNWQPGQRPNSQPGERPNWQPGERPDRQPGERPQPTPPAPSQPVQKPYTPPAERPQTPPAAQQPQNPPARPFTPPPAQPSPRDQGQPPAQRPFNPPPENRPVQPPPNQQNPRPFTPPPAQPKPTPPPPAVQPPPRHDNPPPAVRPAPPPERQQERQNENRHHDDKKDENKPKR